MSFNFPLIMLEEHFLSPAAEAEYEKAGEKSPYTRFPKIISGDLKDLDSGRLEAMDRGGVTLQVISHGANRLALEPSTCAKVNDNFAAATKEHSKRFACFATLPMAYPEAAVKELARCVQNGFVGSLVDITANGRFYDNEFFWPVFQAHVNLDVPFYIHPSYHYEAMDVMYRGNYPEEIAESISLHRFGWHAECALHLLRLFAAKVFDKFPKLKVIIGHMGEMLPFQLDRISRISEAQ